MAHNKKEITFAAWLLIFSLTPVHIVKAFHFHDTGNASGKHAKAPLPHYSDDCYICHFTLSPAVETDRIIAYTYLPAVIVKRIGYTDDIPCIPVCHTSSRAPPSCSAYLAIF